MIDPSIPLHPRDTDRIDLAVDHDVRDWTVALAVGEQELREAVDAVGTCPERVRLYLSIR